MVDFQSYLQYAENLITSTTKGFFAKLDSFTFKMMIDGLKREDYQAVTIIIDQIVKERRPVGIPPLYVVAKKHPNDAVRQKADQALNQLDQQGEVDRLTQGKSIEDAVKILIEHYGNFKSI